MEALSKAELLALLAAARQVRERDFLMILVAYCHGLRASEVIAIKKHDIKDGCLEVQRLKHSERTLQPLPEHENPFLNERQALIAYAEKAMSDDRLFPITRRQFGRIVHQHAVAVGLPEHKRHPHMLKHTIGTEIYDKTKDLRLVKSHLGHARESSSLIYSGRATEIESEKLVQALMKQDG